MLIWWLKIYIKIWTIFIIKEQNIKDNQTNFDNSQSKHIPKIDSSKKAKGDLYKYTEKRNNNNLRRSGLDFLSTQNNYMTAVDRPDSDPEIL